MSTDYADKERTFIASLGEDTGRTLSEWMTAITASGITERNAIIDWLRHQGFPFARASWLERIHHNGGQLIYAGEPEPKRASARDESPDAGSASGAAGPFEPVTAAAATVPATPLAPEVVRLLAAAKGLRPLAEFVLTETAAAVPGVAFAASGATVAMARDQLFAILLPAPKKLRLYAHFGAAAAGRARPGEPISQSPPPFPDMLVLDDARQIDGEFRLLMRLAAGR